MAKKGLAPTDEEAIVTASIILSRHEKQQDILTERVVHAIRSSAEELSMQIKVNRAKEVLVDKMVDLSSHDEVPWFRINVAEGVLEVYHTKSPHYRKIFALSDATHPIAEMVVKDEEEPKSAWLIPAGSDPYRTAPMRVPIERVNEETQLIVRGPSRLVIQDKAHALRVFSATMFVVMGLAFTAYLLGLYTITP